MLLTAPKKHKGFVPYDDDLASKSILNFRKKFLLRSPYDFLVEKRYMQIHTEFLPSQLTNNKT